MADALSDILPGGAGVLPAGMGAAAGGLPEAGVFRTGMGAATGGPPTGDGSSNPVAPADPWSPGAPGAYPFRIEFALAADHQS